MILRHIPKQLSEVGWRPQKHMNTCTLQLSSPRCNRMFILSMFRDLETGKLTPALICAALQVWMCLMYVSLDVIESLLRYTSGCSVQCLM